MRRTQDNLVLLVTNSMLPILAALVVAGLATTLARDAARPPKLFVRAADILELADSLGSNAAPIDSYQRTGTAAFDGLLIDPQDLVAFEENRLFVYALGDTLRLPDGRKGAEGVDNGTRLIRRFIFLKPSTFVIDYQIQTPGSNRQVRWSLYSRQKPEI